MALLRMTARDRIAANVRCLKLQGPRLNGSATTAATAAAADSDGSHRGLRSRLTAVTDRGGAGQRSVSPAKTDKMAATAALPTSRSTMTASTAPSKAAAPQVASEGMGGSHGAAAAELTGLFLEGPGGPAADRVRRQFRISMRFATFAKRRDALICCQIAK